MTAAAQHGNNGIWYAGRRITSNSFYRLIHFLIESDKVAHRITVRQCEKGSDSPQNKVETPIFIIFTFAYFWVGSLAKFFAAPKLGTFPV
jgi:hypothetical protein